MTNDQQQGEPADLTATDNTALNWTVDLGGDHNEQSAIRLVVAAGDAFYFGETGLAFVDYQTTFGEDFRH